MQRDPILRPEVFDDPAPDPGQVGAVMVRMSDVLPEEVSWLWRGRIPLGKLTLFIGDPCVGKSFLLCDLAARVSRGTPWPDRRDEENERGRIVMLTAEDGLADTLRPRLDAAGADVDMIDVLTEVRRADEVAQFRLDRDLRAMEKVIESTSPRIVTIDPIAAYMGKTDTYRDSEVRGVLAPLAALAERYRVAIIGVMHLGKDSARKAMYRGNGSIAFTAAPRAVWAVGVDPEEAERRIMACVKLNVAKAAPGLAYKIVGGAVAWEPNPVEVTADELLGPRKSPEDESAGVEAEAFLRDLLSSGPKASRDVLAQARHAGIAERTLKRAKKRIKAKSRPVSVGDKTRWEWFLPGSDGPGGPTVPRGPHSENGTLGPLADLGPIDDLDELVAEHCRGLPGDP